MRIRVTHRKHPTLLTQDFGSYLLNQIMKKVYLSPPRIDGPAKISEREILLRKASDTLDSVNMEYLAFI